jgi:hypothetical protein
LRTSQIINVSLPTPSKWGINTTVGGRPIIWGTMIINSITNNLVVGTINFRETPIPIRGYWDEITKQITFDSPYARYSGNLTIFDDTTIKIRHLILRGRLMMKPPSIQAGEYGNWIATTNICGNQLNIGETSPSTNQLPPVGVFVTSNYLGNICS